MPEFTVPAPQSSFSNPLPPTPPTPPLPPEPKTNWFKILLLSLAGLTVIFGLVAIGIWYGTQRSATTESTETPTTETEETEKPTDATADWETYTSEKYGFSVKYPSDWSYLEVPNETYQTEGDEVWFSKQEIGFPPAQAGATAPIVLKISDSDPSSEWQPAEYLDDYVKATYTAGNIVGTKISAWHNEALRQIDVVIFGIGDHYIEAFPWSDYPEYLDQILSTFQFTTPAADATVDWETYTGSDYTFEYPPDWELSKSNSPPEVSLKKIDETQEKVLLPGEDQISATYNIIISPKDNPDGLSAKDYYLSSFALSSRTEAESALEEVAVAGEGGILYSEGAAPASGSVKIILVSHKGKFYSFEYGAMAHEETHLKFYEVFNQILSTFQFLD